MSSDFDTVPCKFAEIAVGDKFIDPEMPKSLATKLGEASPSTPAIYVVEGSGTTYHAGSEKKVLRLRPR